MPSVASGSAAGGKLTPLESKIVKTGLQAPAGTITQVDLFSKCGITISTTTQDAINSLLRKNLCQMLKNSKGEIEFRFVGKDEAKAMGSMDSEEKLVFDQIKDAGNLGIWTKVLTSKTGLPRTTITKVLKTLESRKAVKTVKSVKTPTRKIYMLANLTPSVELTGGPWFTDNELDTDFVDALKRCAYKYLEMKSRPPKPTKPKARAGAIKSVPTLPLRPIFPVSATRHLPTVSDIRIYIESLGVAVSVELLDEHVESLLELMVFDGTVEKIFVNSDMADGTGGRKMLPSKKRKRVRGGGDSDDSDDGKPRKKARKGKGAVGGKKKKGKKVGLGKKSNFADDDEDEEEEEPSSDDFDSDEDVETARRRKVKKEDLGQSTKSGKRTKDRRRKIKPGGDSDDDEDGGATSESSNSGDESDLDPFEKRRRLQRGDIKDYVYRLTRPYEPVIGWTDMPCGKCPVEHFCSEPPRALAVIPKKTSSSLGGGGGKPKIGIELEGGIQGVGMIGLAGAAIGVSMAKWGEVRGALGSGVAPVNPRDCQYFKDWLDF